MSDTPTFWKVLTLLILALTPLAACERSQDKATPPRVEEATPVLDSETSIAVFEEATLTSAPVSPTPLPSTPTPHPTPCGLAVQPALAAAWSRLELGCPVTPGEIAVSTAYAPFEGGQMLWRGDRDIIYVLYNDGRWESYANEWREGNPAFTCGEENPLTTPVRGFGRVWCDYPDVRDTLGAATAAEIGDSGSTVQDFVNGTILVAPFGQPFVLVGEDGVWRRVEE